MRRQKDKKHGGRLSQGPGSPRARKAWSAAAVVAVLLAMGAALILPRARLTSPRSGQSLSARTSKVIPDEKDVFAGYAGSASCKDCHGEAYDLWKTSNHAMAERQPVAVLDDPAFHPTRTF